MLFRIASTSWCCFIILLLTKSFGIGCAFQMPARATPRASIDLSFAGTRLRMNEEGEVELRQRSLTELLLPSQSCKVDQMSGTDLAYIGDVVFELFIRSRHVWPSKRTSDLQNIVVGIVRAEHQSKILEKLKTDFPLTEKEVQVLMRGRNAVTRSKNRRDPAAYQDSTSFEALIGYLYICDQQRCTDILNWLDTVVDDLG